MPSKKHLVLDQDVHEALTQRRDMFGLPISRIGNAILRSHIRATLYEHLIGEELVQNHEITWQQYETILRRVDQKVRSDRCPAPADVERIRNDAFIAGSWEIESLLESAVGAFQFLECWARDPRMHPLSQHCHAAEEYLIALGGRCVVVMKGIPSIMTQGCVLRIPEGVVHSATPLDEDCHLLAIIVPAVPEFAVGTSPTSL